MRRLEGSCTARNDALGNFDVMIAAGVAALTGMTWPDHVVPFAISGQFLQSTVGIIVDDRWGFRRFSAMSSLDYREGCG